MINDEHIVTMDRFLSQLKLHTRGSLPQILNGTAIVDKEKTNEYRMLEYELEKFELVEIIIGGNNSTPNGMKIYRLSPLGLKLLISNQSIKTLYADENKGSLSNTINIKGNNLIFNTNSTVNEVSQISNINKNRKTNSSTIKKIIIGLFVTVVGGLLVWIIIEIIKNAL